MDLLIAFHPIYASVQGTSDNKTTSRSVKKLQEHCDLTNGLRQTLCFLKSRLYTKLRLFNVKFHFSLLKSRLHIKSRFIKLRLYCPR